MITNSIPVILFFTGIFLLIMKTIMISNDYNKKQSLNITIWITVIILLLGTAWIMREYNKKEDYDYDYAYRSGKLVSGTVFSSYPDNVPGLGWV